MSNEKTKTMKKLGEYKNTVKYGGMLLAGIVIGWLFFGGSSHDQVSVTEMTEHVNNAHTNEQGEVIYTCSMHPSVRESEPGNCPICGMELIPVKNEASGAEENPYEMEMTEAAMKIAQVQTTEVRRDIAVRQVRLPGKVAVDERNVASISARFPGRIEELYVDFTGQRVKKGEPLASVYSPELVAAQKELLEAYAGKDRNPALYRAARKKLELWELPVSTINSIEQSGEVRTTLDIISPVDGYVVSRNVTREEYVKTGTVMYRVADLSIVWVTFDAYESDLAGLDEGDRVSFSVEAYPGDTFDAEITYIDPVLDPQSRTATVRAEAPNPDRRLKPQMLAEGIVSSPIAGGEEQLLIPRSAVLWTGERSVVYVQKPGSGRPTFEFREIVLGPRAGDRYVVHAGLREGEQVVTNGNFKIDSAAQLAGKMSMMNRISGQTAPPHGHQQHSSMEMVTTAKPDTGNQHQHIRHLDQLVSHYLEARKALADDQFDQAQQHLTAMRREVTGSSEMNDHPEHRAKHNAHHTAMVEAVTRATEAEGIDGLRAAFMGITENLVKAVRNQGYDQQPLFLQYCPMANDGNGVYWVSESREIENPYMGLSMSECGSTEQQISGSQ
ncbi:MAG: efflux RND transporter periplasmic adaptor subunit [Balneolaceae bacterium]|nr:efflux RND transporter periplasmic adaptor subunit [Balneolaceae bacterium]